jgi:copper transport outer membrane protein MctB
MINLRYHIVSLAAVFLALGIGVVMGTTVVDKGVAATLQRRAQAAERRADRIEDDKTQLQRQLSLWDRFGKDDLLSLVRERLARQSAILIIEDGADTALVDQTAATLQSAGAVVGGRVRLSDKWRLEQDAAAEQLSAAIGVQTDDETKLLGDAASLLAARLRRPSDARASNDLLARLAGAGFLTVEGAQSPFPAARALIVAVPAGDGTPTAPERPFVLPLLGTLGAQGRVAVAEPTDAKHFMSDAVRGDRALAQLVSSVDHADTPLGQLSLVEALAQRAAVAAVHFGIRDGATALAPPLVFASAPPRASG